MCITFLFLNPDNPNCPYKLILINNRDEQFARITYEAELKTIGRMKTIHGTDFDAIEHGTWLGLSQIDNTIRIGNLLNVTGERDRRHVKGRGSLAIDYIKSKDSPIIHNRKLSPNFHHYNGFNFLTIELKPHEIKAINSCNIDRTIQHLTMGFHGISNSPFRHPYQKVINGTDKFKEIVESYSNGEKRILINSLMDLLKCPSKHLPCSELSKRRPHDAEVFSSIHVRHPKFHYGSRNRSVILVDHSHNVDYIEERMINEDPVNSVWERKDFRLLGRIKPKGVFPYLVEFSKVVNRLKAVL